MQNKLWRRTTALCLSALFLMTPIAEAAGGNNTEVVDDAQPTDNGDENINPTTPDDGLPTQPDDSLINNDDNGTEPDDEVISPEEPQVLPEPTITTTTVAYNDNHQEGSGATVISGILLVNKKHPLPNGYVPDYTNGAEQSNNLLGEADTACKAFLAAANAQGYNMYVLSGYRSYNTQKNLFASYAARSGVELANTYSARAGQSEHQTGLAFDVGDANNSGYNLQTYMDQLSSIQWMMAHCQEYGFIVRYPKNKQDITGYQYEPWHFRYVGVKAATEIMASGLTLEEFLGDTDSFPSGVDSGRRIGIGRNTTKIAIDGVEQVVSSYNIEGNNYFRVRDLATLLGGTDANFNVNYDEATNSIQLTTHSALVGERTLIELSSTDVALKNTMTVQVDNMLVTPQSYNINGYTYYKLRDMGALLDFIVDWNEETSTVLINTQSKMNTLDELMAPVSVKIEPSVLSV